MKKVLVTKEQVETINKVAKQHRRSKVLTMIAQDTHLPEEFRDLRGMSFETVASVMYGRYELKRKYAIGSFAVRERPSGEVRKESPAYLKKGYVFRISRVDYEMQMMWDEAGIAYLFSNVHPATERDVAWRKAGRLVGEVRKGDIVERHDGTIEKVEEERLYEDAWYNGGIKTISLCEQMIVNKVD